MTWFIMEGLKKKKTDNPFSFPFYCTIYIYILFTFFLLIWINMGLASLALLVKCKTSYITHLWQPHQHVDGEYGE
jgi:hypothetical protein